MSWQPLGIREGGALGECYKGSQLEVHSCWSQLCGGGSPAKRSVVVMEGGQGVEQSGLLVPGCREAGGRPRLLLSALII